MEWGVGIASLLIYGGAQLGGWSVRINPYHHVMFRSIVMLRM